MAPYRRPPLRDLFDDAPTPHIAHPPRTHHRDYYVATDGSFMPGGGGLGVLVETVGGDRVLRIARPDDAPDNNVAEYRALHLGLDALAEHAPSSARVGVLVDHNNLAANVNAAALGTAGPDWPTDPVAVPEASVRHWRGIRARVRGFAEIRAACLRSDRNPAHVLANAPEEYAYVNHEPARIDHHREGGDDESRIPPPSRADRHAGD